MSAHLHGDFLTVCTRRKPRRTWGRTLAGVLMLLAMSALTGWLWSCVRHAALAPVRVPGAAMVPWAVMDGHGAAALPCLAVGLPGIVWAVIWVVRKLRAWDEEALGTGFVRMPVPPAPPEAGKRDACATDPLAVPAMGMSLEDLQRILAAMIAEASEARDLVARARENLSVEDYGDALGGAEKRLQGVIKCLGNLADCVTRQMQEVKPVQVSLKMDMAAVQETLRRNQQMIAGFVSKLAVRAAWRRAYLNSSAAYRPVHGGRAA